MPSTKAVSQGRRLRALIVAKLSAYGHEHAVGMYRKMARYWNRRGVPVKLLLHVMQTAPMALPAGLARCSVCKMWGLVQDMDDTRTCDRHWLSAS